MAKNKNEKSTLIFVAIFIKHELSIDQIFKTNKL